MKNKIEAKIIADSLTMYGHRLTTMVIKFPRYILAELNTHRAISKNSASSRAKPFKTMLKSVTEDPFIPVAWMKDHPGMQGSEFFTDSDFIYQLEKCWLSGRDAAVDTACGLSDQGLTKQMVNRILEPFMWHEVIVTATDWENFFGLRCPWYEVNDLPDNTGVFSSCIVRSRKDAIELNPDLAGLSDLEWRKRNSGMADIHIMDLAEAMWDAYNESQPKVLQDGEWHMPYTDDIDVEELIRLLYDNAIVDYNDYWSWLDDDTLANKYLLKISAARCARISYKTFGEDSKIDLLADIKLHDRLLVSKPIHASPAEHQGQAMNEIELRENYIYNEGDTIQGASRNFRGFRQYRTLLANETIW